MGSCTVLADRLPSSDLREQAFDGIRDIAHSLIEHRLIRARGLAESTHLPNKLKSGRRDFLTRGGIGAAKNFDAAAHAEPRVTKGLRK
jgi:hypothetical protein